MSSSTPPSSHPREMSEILALLQEIANRLPDLKPSSPAPVQPIHHHETRHGQKHDVDEGAVPFLVQTTRDLPSSSSSTSSSSSGSADQVGPTCLPLGSLDPKAVWLPQAYREVAGQVDHVPLGPACVLPSADDEAPLANALRQQFEALRTALRVCVASGKEAAQLPSDDLHKKVMTVLLYVMRLQLDMHDALQVLHRAKESPSAISAPPPPVCPAQRGTTVGKSRVYARYFKMIAVGVPREAVKQRMSVAGLDPAVLDMDPSAPLPPPSAPHKPIRRVVSMERYFRMVRAGVPVGAVEQTMAIDGVDPKALHSHGTVGESPVYARYFKMAAVGVPGDAVKQKMAVDGFDPAILNMDASLPLPPPPSPAIKPSPAQRMDRFLKMLRAGVPVGAIEQAMKQAGVDPAALHEYGTIGESRVIAPFLKMVAVGVPREAVKQKMSAAGLDASVLDMDPGLPLPSASIKKPKPRAANLSRYFKMVRAGVPLGAVEQLMTIDGVDPKALHAHGTVGQSRQYARYFRMVSFGVPREAVKQRMAVDGLDPAVLDMDTSLPLPPNPAAPKQRKASLCHFFKMLRAGVPLGAVEQAMKQVGLDPAALYGHGTIGQSPEHTRYFKMAAVGVPHEAVKQKMAVDGLDPAVLDMDLSMPLPPSWAPMKLGRRCANLKRYFRMLRAGVPLGAVEQAMKQACIHPAALHAHGPLNKFYLYARYLRMASVGVPREAIKQRMSMAGLDPSMLDMEPSVPLLPAYAAPQSGHTKPNMPRYFKMLRAGVPLEAVEQAMNRDGLDPASLHANGTIGESPVYASYFKMAAVGVPREGVKQKMAVDRLDPAVLDMDPSLPMPPSSGSDLAWVDLSRYFKMLRAGVPLGAVEQAMKQAGLNPDAHYVDGLLSRSRMFAPYLKMIAVGVPAEAVKQKMMVEGFDPFMIDLDPTQPVPKRAYRRVTLHRYFKMLRAGVPVGAVEQAMAQAGLDPACMLLWNNAS